MSPGDPLAQMASGISSGGVVLSRDGIYVLVLTLAGTTDQLVISGQSRTELPSGKGGIVAGVDQVRFDCGSVWNRAAIKAVLAPVATAGNDELFGFEDADVIDAGFGNDLIRSGDGNDALLGDTHVFGKE